MQGAKQENGVGDLTEKVAILDAGAQYGKVRVIYTYINGLHVFELSLAVSFCTTRSLLHWNVFPPEIRM